MSLATVSSKGSIVIPQDIREKYNIRSASKVEVIDIGGRVMILPIPANPVKAARGMLKFKGSALDIIGKYRREELMKERGKR